MICLARLKEGRTQRGLEILHRVNRRLSDLGRAPLDGERVRQYASGVLTRPHLAQALVDQGYCKGHQEAFPRLSHPLQRPQAVAVFGRRHLGWLPMPAASAPWPIPASSAPTPTLWTPCCRRQIPRPRRPRGRTTAPTTRTPSRFSSLSPGVTISFPPAAPITMAAPVGPTLGEIAPGYPVPGAVLSDLQQLPPAANRA